MTKFTAKNIVVTLTSFILTSVSLAGATPIGTPTISAATMKSLYNVTDHCLQQVGSSYEVIESCSSVMSFRYVGSDVYQGWIQTSGQRYSIQMLIAQYSRPLSAPSNYQQKNGNSLVIRSEDGRLVGQFLDVNTKPFSYDARQSLLDLLR